MSSVSAASGWQSFWQRQVSPLPTTGQINFDLTFGIVLPIICLWFDPIVFRSPFGGALLGKYAVVGGIAIGLGFVSLTTWLLLRRSPALFAGLLCGGAIFATLLGIVLLPYSVIGLLAVIGVLGFSPFATAFVFWRNAVRAYHKAREGISPVLRWMFVIVGLLITCGGPWAVHGYVSHELSQASEMILSPDQAEVAHGIAVLKRFQPIVNLDEMVIAYEAEKDASRRQRLAAVYKELTGVEIEHRLAILRD
jgi:hypothetical protein